MSEIATIFFGSSTNRTSCCQLGVATWLCGYASIIMKTNENTFEFATMLANLAWSGSPQIQPFDYCIGIWASVTRHWWGQTFVLKLCRPRWRHSLHTYSSRSASSCSTSSCCLTWSVQRDWNFSTSTGPCRPCRFSDSNRASASVPWLNSVTKLSNKMRPVLPLCDPLMHCWLSPTHCLLFEYFSFNKVSLWVLGL